LNLKIADRKEAKNVKRKANPPRADKSDRIENQPTGTKLEYRVKVINASGESIQGNTVAVVL